VDRHQLSDTRDAESEGVFGFGEFESDFGSRRR
jgi:hypothetical protein